MTVDWTPFHVWCEENEIDDGLAADFVAQVSIKDILDAKLDRPIDRLRVLQHVSDKISHAGEDDE